MITRPRVLLGDTRSGKLVRRIRQLGWGRCVVRDRPAPSRGEFWMLDCGSWPTYARAAADGRDPAEVVYERDHFRSQLDAEWAQNRAMRSASIIVVPDRIGDGLGSLVESIDWLHDYWSELQSRADEDDSTYDACLRAFMSREHMPWYLGVQPGMTPHDLDAACWHCDEPIRDHFAGILLGGTASWKGRTGAFWAAYARRHRLRLHYPRAGTPAKFDHAVEIGADSIDSALPLWTMDRFEQFRGHVMYGPLQISLSLLGG
ncbi:MAG: hypothetical protein ACJ8GN_19415 [Longimicrobiaceae bacterium]